MEVIKEGQQGIVPVKFGRGLTKRIVLAERRRKGIALLAAFALWHGPTCPHGVPPAVAGGLAIQESREGENFWCDLA